MEDCEPRLGARTRFFEKPVTSMEGFSDLWKKQGDFERLVYPSTVPSMVQFVETRFLSIEGGCGCGSQSPPNKRRRPEATAGALDRCVGGASPKVAAAGILTN